LFQLHLIPFLDADVMRFLIFSDLDGSFLDHNNYDFSGSVAAAEAIMGEGWPLVFVTSKTRPEVERIQAEIGLPDPFVVENGGGIFFPANYDRLDLPDPIRVDDYRLIRLGCSYDEVRGFVDRLPQHLSITGFGDMTLEDVQAATGLSEHEASMARSRDFTEPFLPSDASRVPELEILAQAAGLKIVQGGRFYHLMGSEQDKGRAVRLTTEVFRNHWGEPVITVGLGDSMNDLPMLETVDIPILIPNPGGSPPPIAWDHLIVARFPGSKGWGDAVLRLMSDL
jgi:mannosyl-3-phosphoglycerate phosphatase